MRGVRCLPWAMKTQHPVTIMTVAAEAGVSMKTVSRVLNNEAHVRPGTREKVMEAVRALGYRPNTAARSLAGSRSYLIALIYDNPSADYVVGLQEGAMRACQAAGYSLLPHHYNPETPGSVSVFETRLQAGGLDGVIISSPLSERVEVVQKIADAGVPMVLVGAGRVEGVTTVGIDDQAATRELANHLIACGHRRIGIVRGPPHHRSSSRREVGIRDALRDAGIAFDASLAMDGDYTFSAGLDAGRQLLDLPERPGAIMAMNDHMAAGVLVAAHERRLSVPGDLSVTGFDDTSFAGLVWPPLTTIRQPLADIAERAVRSLVLATPDETSEQMSQSLEFEVILRHTTSAPKRPGDL